MPYADVLDSRIHPETTLQSVIGPHLDSLDSAEEFSLDHLRELYQLLEIEDRDLGGFVFDDTCLRVA